jgi:Holliday junction DNA helicase RuvA
LRTAITKSLSARKNSMLGSLTGQVTGRLGQRILIEVEGVGYWVHTGAWQPTGTATCYLYQQVREDINELFGFPDLESLDLFEQLISVSGVGPKAGLAVLSLGDSNRIINAIIQNDLAFLSLAPGIGKKAAEKITVELKTKLRLPSVESGGTLHDDLRAALEGLGYKVADIQPYLINIPAEYTELDSQLKWILKQLSQ